MIRFLEILFGVPAGEWAGAESWRPRFAGAPESGWAVLALAATLGAIVWLIVRTYKREGSAPPAAKAMLAGVRILIVAMIVAICAAPTIVLRRVHTETSIVAIVIDDSLSMSIADAPDDPARRASLAAAAGMSEAEVADASRLQIVRGLLTRAGGPVETLAADHSVVLMAFGGSDPDGHVRRLGASEGSSLDIGSAVARLGAGGRRTDLVAAIRQTLDELRGRRVAAVVLLTDGQPTAGAGDQARLTGAGELLRRTHTRLLTVCVGDPTPRPNVRVESLVIEPDVRQGASVDARVIVRSANCGGRTATVRLLRKQAAGGEWLETGVTAPVALADGADGGYVETVVPMTITCPETGSFSYRATIDAAADELLDDDNRADARVSVRDAKTRVLLISADAGWEFQYIRNCLARDPQRYLLSVWQQNAPARFSQEVSTGVKLSALPSTVAELIDAFDVVLLYDPAHTQGGFDPAFVELLRTFVSTHRGGLGYIASKKHTGENLASGAFDGLAGMLPVVAGRGLTRVAERIGRDVRIGWPIRLTGAGADHPVMQLDRDPQANRALWGVLPGVYWSHPVRDVKPGAITLAVSSDPADRTDAGDPVPMVAAQMYGRGPVLYVGFDATWRWRYVREGKVFRRFWFNVIDHLGSYRLMKRRVILTTAGDSFPVGAEVRIIAEVYDAEYRPLADPTYSVTLVNTSTGSEQVVELSRAGASSAAAEHASPLYRRSVRLSEPGQFELIASDAPLDEVTGAMITVTTPRAEFARPESNPDLLRLLASEGDAMTAEQFGSLAERIAPDRRRIVRETSHALWNVWAVFVVLWTLLMIEWIGRKKYNMN